MRTQYRNRQKMWYSCPDGDAPIYELDENGDIKYIECDGEKIPVMTGETEPAYSEPVEFRGSIHSQLEDAIMRAWGSDSKNYAILVVGKNSLLNLKNGCRIWRKSKIERKNGRVDGSSADYEVSGVLDEELNEDSYYLKKLDGGSDEEG